MPPSPACSSISPATTASTPTTPPAAIPSRITCKDVKILPGGVSGSYIQCGNNQLLSYWAPGNIYSQRGTLSFFWRSRDPLDETEFPVFRVGFADHSSWDMVWLRIDWNGHGFDAFVTDVNLGRTRVSVKLPEIPKPDQWMHLALAWDETSGIRFYIDGKLMATRKPPASSTPRSTSSARTRASSAPPASRAPTATTAAATSTNCASTTACSPTTTSPASQRIRFRKTFRRSIAPSPPALLPTEAAAPVVPS